VLCSVHKWSKYSLWQLKTKPLPPVPQIIHYQKQNLKNKIYDAINYDRILNYNRGNGERRSKNCDVKKLFKSNQGDQFLIPILFTGIRVG
jgi:hypothetical protein